MLRHVPEWAARYRRWADPALALLFAVAALWIALLGGDEPNGDVYQVPLDGLPPLPAEESRPMARIVLATLLVTVPLAGRRRWPLAVFAVQFAAVIGLRGDNTWVTLLALLVGAYSLAAYSPSPLVSIGAQVTAATGVAIGSDSIELPVPDWTAAFIILLPAGLFGITVRALRAKAAASAERAEALRAGQQAATRAAVAEDRARLARELHDVVSHHVSVMVIQAGAADKVIGARPDLARDALTAIGASGRQAMAELRHLLGVLAPDGGEDLLHPQPGLDQLGALVEQVRAAGQPVTVEHTPVSVPRGVDVAAYRVVQEALTNALRYAPGARTTVIVRPADGVLTVEVTDDGAQVNGGSDPVGAGSGLRGLAERLRVYGGTLHTGHRLAGGFRVLATFPLEAQ
ncbi:sensor histidine kinase [Phytohabitans rumicis]|uniref:sensor histidine kinase n=1 Tax=Phytohabitans rumicis TaxID=1076125 RepID=UPI0031EAA90D